MSIIVVGVGDLATTNFKKGILKTYALGSCVGVVALAPRLKAVGLLHVMLPDSNINQKMAIKKPAMFADTGIPALLNEMAKLGCYTKDLTIKIVGGANILDTHNHFQIGKRNILAVKKVLWKYKLGPLAEDVGKDLSRTVSIEIGTCKVLISSPGKGEWEI